MSKLIDGINDLKTAFPNVATEWHPTKNGKLSPSNVTYGSGKKVWWKCAQGHSWQASVCNRIKGAGCPYCSGRYPVEGENDLLTLDPSLAQEWNYERNKDLTPSSVSSKSSKKIWWKCDSGHEWQATAVDRARGNGCPYCSGRRILTGFNDLTTLNPQLALEWDRNKNTNMSPELISPNSHKKVWWICSSCGNEWVAQIKSRNSGCGCPECAKGARGLISHKNNVSKYGSLGSNNTRLASEWHPNKNGNLSPNDVSSNSGCIVWWKCNKGHEWQAAICDRSRGTGCPYCSNRIRMPGYNDLATINPNLASEWNYEKNSGLINGNGIDISTPDKVSAVSGQSVWWKCSKGHEWQAKISNRVNGRGCPLCSSAGTSVPEQGVAFYLESVCRIEQRISIENKEIDIYIPDFNIGVEYDGAYYHGSKNELRDSEKDVTLIRSGIRLIRIKESTNNEVVEGNPLIIKYGFDYLKDNYEWAIRTLCVWLARFTGNDEFNCIDIDVKRDLLKIRERINLYNKNESISNKYPEIAKDWNYERNGILTPDMFTFGSDIRVWWKCSNGHEWQTSISHRTNRGDGCPFCSQKRTLKGYNDFKSWCQSNSFDYLLDEWDYSKNDDPSMYSRQSREKVWWKCSRGHEWQSSVGHRADGHGCPYCNGGMRKKVINTDTGEVFNSMKEAAEAYGMKSSNPISKCCLGEQKTAGGFHWEYYDELSEEQRK